MSDESPPDGSVRRATPADAAAIAAFAPGFPPPTMADDRATFVIDGESGPLAAVDLVQHGDHLGIEQVAVAAAGTADHLRTLIAFAEAAARAVGVRKVRLAPGALPREFAASLGYADGTKTISTGALARARDHLEAVGVPLWRDGTASVSQTFYYRGVWAAVALLIGLGSVSLAVFSSSHTTLFHVVTPAVLCAATSIFAVWQIALIAAAARRGGGAIVPLAAIGCWALRRRGWPLALVAAWLAVNPVFYSFFRNLPQHPRFLYASLPALWLLTAAGAAWLGRGAWRRLPGRAAA